MYDIIPTIIIATSTTTVNIVIHSPDVYDAFDKLPIKDIKTTRRDNNVIKCTVDYITNHVVLTFTI